MWFQPENKDISEGDEFSYLFLLLNITVCYCLGWFWAWKSAAPKKLQESRTLENMTAIIEQQ
jgi:hypothetical protein